MLLELQARSLPTDKLRPAYIAVNSIIYVVQVSSSPSCLLLPVHGISFMPFSFFLNFKSTEFFKIIFANFDSVPLLRHLDRSAYGYTSE
jgi:hypothetical protein